MIEMFKQLPVWLLPAILITIDIIAALRYAIDRKPYNAGYWIAAAAISFCAVKMKG